MKKLTKQFLVSVYDDGSARITERKLARRDTRGRFTSDYTIRLRKKRLTCAYAKICPFRASAIIENF